MSRSSCVSCENVNPLEIQIICEYFGQDTPENISTQQGCEWISKYATHFSHFRELIEQGISDPNSIKQHLYEKERATV